MDSCWYYYLFSEEFGPVTRQQLVDMVDDGTLAAADKVRHVSGEVQQEVGSVLGLDAERRVAARSTAPVATPLSLVGEGESGSVSAESVAEIAGGLSIDDFVIEKTSDDSQVAEAPETPPPAEPPAASPAQENFYLRSSETTIGPLSLDALCRMADAGKVASADYIRRESESGWHPANEVPEVMASVLMQEASRPRKKARRSGDSDVRRRLGGGGSSVRPRGGRNGKKKPKSRDEKLQGIFDEVFRDKEPDTSSTSETRPAAAASPPAAEIPASPQASAAAVPENNGPPATSTPPATDAGRHGGAVNNGMAGQMPPAAGQMPAAGMNGGMNPAMGQQMAGAGMPGAGTPTAGGLYGNSAGMGAIGGMNGAGTAAQPVKPWVPPKKKKKSGGGMDPDLLRKLGIVAGVVAAVVLIPVLWFMLPGSNSAPDSSTVKPELLAMVGRYETASASAGSWQTFQEEVRPRAGGWVKQYRAAGQRTPEQLKLQEAATQLVQLVNSKFDDKEKHQKFLDKINEQLGGSAG